MAYNESRFKKLLSKLTVRERLLFLIKYAKAWQARKKKKRNYRPRVHQDMVGKRFNKLVVIEFAVSRKGKTFWICICDCGKITTPIGRNNLIQGATKSCGCLRRKRG